MQTETWRGSITHVDAAGYEHRILSVERGWKLRIQDRMTGKLIHEENGCKDILEALDRDRLWLARESPKS